MVGDVQVVNQRSANGADTVETLTREMRHRPVSLCTNTQVIPENSKPYDK